MDSNKEFINIDELFQQMREPIQQEYSSDAAWARFKNQLDEELPVVDAKNGKGKRRYFVPLLALLIGVGGVATGYYIGNSERAGYANNTPINMQQPVTIGQSYAVAINEAKASKSNSNITASNTEVVAANSVQAPTHANSNKATAQTTSARLAQNNTPNTNNSKSGVYKTPASGTSSNNDDGSKVANPIVALAHTAQPATHNTIGKFAATNNTITFNDHSNSSLNEPQDGKKLDHMLVAAKPSQENLIIRNASNTQQEQIQHLENINHTQNLNKGIPDVAPLKGEIQPSSYLASNNAPEALGTSHPNTANSNEKPFVQRITKDNINYVQDEKGDWFQEKETPTVITHQVIKKDPATGELVTSVISTNRELITKYIPTDDNIIKENTAKTSDLVSLNTTTENIKFTDLKSLNESQTTTGSAITKNNNFFKNIIQRDDIMRFFSQNNKFEAMITFGGLYSPAATGAYGYGIGVGGLYTLAERLSIALEAKYVRKVFTNFYQEDLSKEYQVNQNGSLYSGTERISSYEYSIKNYNSFEIPLYLSYNISSRLSIIGGVQYVYAAPIKWNLNKVVETNFYTSLEAPKPQQTIINQQNDFTSRSGFGYLAGVSFDASKKVSIDFRVSQNFYNKQYTTNNVINSIYNAPVFSVTLGYYFGKKDKIYYLMSNNKK